MLPIQALAELHACAAMHASYIQCHCTKLRMCYIAYSVFTYTIYSVLKMYVRKFTLGSLIVIYYYSAIYNTVSPMLSAPPHVKHVGFTASCECIPVIAVIIVYTGV